MEIKNVISLEARDKMREEIEKADGNEVFFRGIPDENGVVTKVVVLARGNKHSAPAILKGMRKDEVMIHNHPSGYLYPSDADVSVASIYSNSQNGAFYIINNQVSEVNIVVPLITNDVTPIDIEPYFSKDGMLSQVFKGFEYRDEQLDMAKHIENGLNSSTTVVVEAGTGTGKTLAYLIPAIEWAIKNKRRVVITTNTINLQEQLLNKDIPIAKRVIQDNFSYILVKGRGNYLCNRKYFNVQMVPLASYEELTDTQKSHIEEILKWGEDTNTGDRAELYFEVDRTVWEMFQSESDLCAGAKCPYSGECFFLKSREEKKKADVLITNHHLYFSDLAIRKQIGFNSEFSILPEYGLVVFDEAHNVEKVARDYFSHEVSRYSFTKVMNQILFVTGKKKNTGAFDLLRREIKKEGLDSDIVKNYVENIGNMHNSLFALGREYFDHLIKIFSNGEMGVFTFRARKEEMDNSPFYTELNTHKTALVEEYKRYIRDAKKLIEILTEKNEDSFAIIDYSKYIDRLEGFFQTFNFIHQFEDEDFIYWIEVNSRKSNSKLVATPLKVDKELEENLYNHIQNLIFTSATIAVGSDFHYFKESIGLDTLKTTEKVIHSPFDYDNQMVAYIPTDIVDPKDKTFLDEAAEIIKGQVIASKGNTFILFTSYQALNYVYYSIRKEVEENGIDILVQGMAPRSHIVNMYKNANNPVLFGTDSFWEGVDIKGDKLSNVVIVKLPFKVPSDPVTEAIIENITAQGKNSFMEYQIPEAVIKFKQGVGRLIRSKSDSGSIIVLDNRVVTKRYGKYFRDSIPTKNIKAISKTEMLKEFFKK